MIAHEVWPCWSKSGLVGGSASLWGWALRSYAPAPASVRETLLLDAYKRKPSPGCLQVKM